MASSHLMSEEDVREYFLQNNGIVRNTDIVNYFRPYLSDPNIRDEARVLFKSYVNKLSSVKTENGEKFLVLKRQYFHPIDGNGNGRPVAATPGFPSHYNSPPTPLAYNSPPYNNPPSNIYGGYPPPQVRNDPVPSHYNNTMSRPTLQRSLSQQSYSMSQSHLYGSAFSLSSVSNYGGGDPYSNPPVHANNNYSAAMQAAYPSNINIPPPYPNPPMSYNPPPPPSQPTSSSVPDYDYGLPPIPSNPMAPPRRYPTSSLSTSSLSLNSSMSASRLPPPYRPPPPTRPIARFPSSPPQAATAPLIRNPMNNFPPRYPPPPPLSQSYSSEPPTPTAAIFAHQYQRSLSVPSAGIVTSGPGEAGLPHGESALPTPPPPVPPRSKRGGYERGPRPPVGTGATMSDDGDDEGGFVNSNNFIRSERSNSMGTDDRGGMNKELVPAVMELRRSNSEGAASGVPDAIINDENNKENMDLANGNSSGAYDTSPTIDSNSSSGGGGGGGSNSSSGSEEGRILNGNCVNGNVNSDVEQKISVKERLQKFNRIASESELSSTSPPKMPPASTIRSRRENNSNKHDSVDFDTASLSSFGFGFAHMQPKDKEWILKAANCDYHALNKMAQENPSLVKRRDMNYTALHWAAKHGNAELVKLLAGTYKSDINCKSNGGYTPLHLAAQFSRQDVYDLLVKVYNADPNVRDYSGKKPMQYLVRQDTTVSMDTFKKLKEKRRSHEQGNRESFLRIGSLNVRVKKTTEAFGNFLGKSNSSASIERILHKNWGSADNIPEAEDLEKDKQLMPPPSTGSAVRRVTSKVNGKRRARRSAPASDSPAIKESHTDSDSDTACGFGSDWKNGS